MMTFITILAYAVQFAVWGMCLTVAAFFMLVVIDFLMDHYEAYIRNREYKKACK